MLCASVSRKPGKDWVPGASNPHEWRAAIPGQPPGRWPNVHPASHVSEIPPDMRSRTELGFNAGHNAPGVVPSIEPELCQIEAPFIRTITAVANSAVYYCQRADLARAGVGGDWPSGFHRHRHRWSFRDPGKWEDATTIPPIYKPGLTFTKLPDVYPPYYKVPEWDAVTPSNQWELYN